MEISDTRTHNVVKAGLPGWHVKKSLPFVCLLLPTCCCPQYRFLGPKPVRRYHRAGHAHVLPYSSCSPLTLSVTLMAASSLSTLLRSLQKSEEVTAAPLAIPSLCTTIVGITSEYWNCICIGDLQTDHNYAQELACCPSSACLH